MRYYPKYFTNLRIKITELQMNPTYFREFLIYYEKICMFTKEYIFSFMVIEYKCIWLILYLKILFPLRKVKNVSYNVGIQENVYL